jgi:hypothetical protein
MARKPTAIKIYEPERGEVPARSEGYNDRAYLSFLTELNPRGDEDIQRALASTEDPRYKEFLERLMMPKYAKVSLATIAKGCNITLRDFNNWSSKAANQIALAKAQFGSVKITADMVEDAKTKTILCARCDGLKFVPAPPGLPDDVLGYKMVEEATATQPAKYIRDCPNCCAEGTVKKPGDQHARDKVLDMAGLIKKGPAIAIIQNLGGASHSSAVDDLTTLDITAEDI